MLSGKSCYIQETHYDILSVKEDATHEEIRTCYRFAILNSHPDKLANASETSPSHNGSEERFFKVQKAWEILSNPRSRALYDSELRSSRQDVVTAEDISLEDMMVEDGGDMIELFYQCRCGDYFSVDSLELGKMGYPLLRDGSKISLLRGDALPASVVLPCGSCSLKVRLLINSDICVSIDDNM
ncbi:Terminal organelle assembly protein [Parasponia andersonii]|uniref:Terminal organelle assembly protein n=1 Tax=Parasponia andersonii TaxID=3476 RepID=A0A2P5ASS6_PARAD|nr:Terminal organelle assembly protein [Parasponia andersonii]